MNDGGLPLWPFLGALGGALFAPFAKNWIDVIFQRFRAAEEARDALLSEILDMSRMVFEDATLYWGSSAKELGKVDAACSARLTAGLHHMNGLFYQLFESDVESLKQTRGEFLDVSDLVGIDFGDPDRLAEPNRLPAIYKNLYRFNRGVRSRRARLRRSILV